MRKVINSAFIIACLLMASCASMNQIAQKTDQSTVVEDDYKLLEQKLIEDYLAYHKYDPVREVEEEEVMVYNTNDELEFQGKAENSDARVMVLKGDLLIHTRNLQIYRLQK